MRRKSERNKPKAAEKRTETPPKKSRRGRRRKRVTSSSSENSDDAPLQTVIASAEVTETEVSPPSDEQKKSESHSNSDEEKEEQPIWKVKTSDASSGEIQKLKICLQRPSTTPERTEKSPRRRRGKGSSQSDDASLTPDEKLHHHRRKTHGSPYSSAAEGSLDNSAIETEKDETLFVNTDTNEVVLGKGKLDSSQTNQENEIEECVQGSQYESENNESLIQSEIKQDIVQSPQPEERQTILSEVTDEQTQPIKTTNEDSKNEPTTVEVPPQNITEIDEGSSETESPKFESMEVVEDKPQEAVNETESQQEISMETANITVEPVIAPESEKEEKLNIPEPSQLEERNIPEQLIKQNIPEPEQPVEQNIPEPKKVKELNIPETVQEKPIASAKEETKIIEPEVQIPVPSEDKKQTLESEEVHTSDIQEESLPNKINNEEKLNEFQSINEVPTVDKSPEPEQQEMESKSNSSNDSNVSSPEQKLKTELSHIESDSPEFINKRQWSKCQIDYYHLLITRVPVYITSETIKSKFGSLRMLREDELKLETKEKEIIKPVKKDREVTIPQPVSPVKQEEEVEKEVSNIGLNRKISIVDDEASKLQPPPSPAKNPTSSVLFITNLVRPFTLKHLQELLSRTGKIIEGGFWTDKIKSKCYVQYETEEEAEATRNALHGVQWPIGNGKKLIIEFGTTDAMEAARKNIPDLHTTGIKKASEKSTDKNHESPEKKENSAAHDKNDRWDKTRSSAPIREWDLGKVAPDHRDRSHSRDRTSSRTDKDRADKRRLSRFESPSNGDHLSARKKKKEEQTEVKLMDDLFHKTKATPSIYWLPLSPDQIAKKQQQRLQRMAEHKRRMEESRRTDRDRDFGRGPPPRSRRRTSRYDGD